MSQPTW